MMFFLALFRHEYLNFYIDGNETKLGNYFDFSHVSDSNRRVELLGLYNNIENNENINETWDQISQMADMGDDDACFMMGESLFFGLNPKGSNDSLAKDLFKKCSLNNHSLCQLFYQIMVRYSIGGENNISYADLLVNNPLSFYSILSLSSHYEYGIYFEQNCQKSHDLILFLTKELNKTDMYPSPSCLVTDSSEKCREESNLLNKSVVLVSKLYSAFCSDCPDIESERIVHSLLSQRKDMVDSIVSDGPMALTEIMDKCSIEIAPIFLNLFRDKCMESSIHRFYIEKRIMSIPSSSQFEKERRVLFWMHTGSVVAAEQYLKNTVGHKGVSHDALRIVANSNSFRNRPIISKRSSKLILGWENRDHIENATYWIKEAQKEGGILPYETIMEFVIYTRAYIYGLLDKKEHSKFVNMINQVVLFVATCMVLSLYFYLRKNI